MTVTAVPRRSIASGPRPSPLAPPGCTRAAASQRVLHRLVRRELRLLAELSARAPAGEADRITALTRHAELIGRVLLHHHAMERELLWPALHRVAGERPGVADALAYWAAGCARIDAELRRLGTAGRQWAVARTGADRDRFGMACLDLATTVAAHTDHEERLLLPALAEHLDPADWTAIARRADARLSRREKRLVLGLALEDAPAVERARLLSGLRPGARRAWRLYGSGRYRAAVVRLRGEPPAR